MSVGAVLSGLVLGLLVNECSDLSPWLADKLVRWSARLRCADTEDAEVLAEDLAAYIADRPAKLLKLLVSIGFVAAALPRRIRGSRHVESFWNRPGTWEGQFRGFFMLTSLSCALLTFPGFGTFACWAAAMLPVSWATGRISKFREGGRISRLERPYALCLMLFFLPGTYISCIAVTTFTVIRVIEGHQSWGIWLGLIINVLQLQAPLTWSAMVRVQRRAAGGDRT